MDEPAPDLRTRKKQATREALSRAALRLALERGPQNVRVDDIAAEAGVSPRTYNNYFGSREEAICAVASARAQQVGEALAARPAEEPLADAVVHAMLAAPAGAPAEPDRDTLALFLHDPALRAHFISSHMRIEEVLAESIAARLGIEVDVRCRVLASSAVGASRVAIRTWLHGTPDVPLATVLRETITLAMHRLAGLEETPC